ncbi:MAG: hypothetical protein QOH76_3915 [Thermoleophilaceae bacterium]|jgi:hypothetical protein|nr:hypothetical protein [Thermoleophilaceae bacterium]
MSRVALVVAVAAVALLAIAGAAGAGSPQAHAAGKCNIKGQERKLGASYVTSLRVTKTSCRTGKSVVRAYNKCRHRSGGAKGHCHHKVKHYKCSEHRAGVSTQFDASVTCKRGAKRVKFTYTENT